MYAGQLPFNTNNNHPLIPSAQEYIYYNKYISIHSEDRDYLKYPNSSEFEIELPEDLTNVASITLSKWSFPANFSLFRKENDNLTMTFKIIKPYNAYGPYVSASNVYLIKIFEFLMYNKDNNYSITIEEGFYNPSQLITELQNKFNTAVNNALLEYLLMKYHDPNVIDKIAYLNAITSTQLNGGYNKFVVVYNIAKQNIWFGNTSDQFVITNETQIDKLRQNYCIRNEVPNYSNWGLPGYIGFERFVNPEDNNIVSTNTSDEVNDNAGSYYKYIFPITTVDASQNKVINIITVPRFYYGTVATPGDSGFWLTPNNDLQDSNVYWVECPNKINLMGESHFYLDLYEHNCADETSPFVDNTFTQTTNQTNSVVNSYFAKIPVIGTPVSNWFDANSPPYKFYYPPAERIRKLRVRFRYHNGELVNFETFNYTFTLQFTIQLPQILRKSNTSIYPGPVVK